MENLLVLLNIWGSDRDNRPLSCCVNCNFCRYVDDFPFIHNSDIVALVFYNMYIFRLSEIAFCFITVKLYCHAKHFVSGCVLLGEAVECCTLDGESLVAESITSLRSDLCSMGHMESCCDFTALMRHIFFLVFLFFSSKVWEGSQCETFVFLSIRREKDQPAVSTWETLWIWCSCPAGLIIINLLATCLTVQYPVALLSFLYILTLICIYFCSLFKIVASTSANNRVI